MTLIPRRKAAKVLGVHHDTIDVWRKGKYLPAVAVPNGYLYDLNECQSLAEQRKNRNYLEGQSMYQTKNEHIYDYYVVKVDLKGEDEERFNRIMKKQGIRFKSVLLRELILQSLCLIEQDVYKNERIEEDWLTSLYDQGLDYSGVCEIMTGRYWRRSQYISKKDR